MTECERHSWRYLRTTLPTKTIAQQSGVVTHHSGEDVFYCTHCLRYATRAEILKEQE